MVDLLSTVALVGLFTGAALLFRPEPCPRCRARAVRFEESSPWVGRDRCVACGWQADSDSVDV